MTRRVDLVAQRASGDREGDQDPDPAVVVQVDVAEHPEIDDRSVQLRVLDRTERIDDLLARDWHGVHCAGVTGRICRYQGVESDRGQ